MQGTARIDRPATEKQIAYIHSLAERVGKPVPESVDLTTWNTGQASEMIETLKALAPIDAPRMATERQREYIAGLLDEREVTGALAIWTPETLGSLTAEQASELIRELKVQPRKPASPDQQFASVPDGHYALDSNSADQDTMFVEVWTYRNGTRGVAIQAGDDYHPASRSFAQSVLKRIEDDVVAATVRYGHEIGRCGVCNRTLTDETSRARGIGPVCASKMGI